MDKLKSKELPDARDIWLMIKRRKWLLIIPWVLTSVVVIVGSRFLTPVYQASTIILLDREVRLSSELQGLMGLTRNYRAGELQMDELRAYRNEITSSSFMFQLSDRLKLDANPEVQRQIQAMLQTNPGLDADQVKLYVIQRKFWEGIRVRSVGAAQIEIAVESNSPTEARDVANILGELFVTERLRQDVTSVRSSQNFSDIQLEKYEKLLQEKTTEKTNFEKKLLKNRLDPLVASETNRNQIQSEIDQTQQDIADNQSNERALLSQLNSGDNQTSIARLVLSDSKLNQQSKEALKGQLRSVGELLQTYTWNDPQTLTFRLKHNSLLSSIEGENKRLVGAQFPLASSETKEQLTKLFTVRANLDFYVAKANYLKTSLDEINDRISRMPEDQATIDRLSREIATATEIRDRFKKQQEGSSISQALLQDMSSVKYRIVEPAMLPLYPVRPNLTNISLIGVLLGLALGCMAAVIAEFSDASFKKPQDLEQYLDVDVLAVVPRIAFLPLLKKQFIRES
jgi:uncharacterized protein involved in exopolysaccharide biosynthesis